MALTPKVIEPIDFSLVYETMTQDQVRDGFRNLGSVNSFHLTTAADLLINGQGGNDAIVLPGTGNDIVFSGSGDDYVLAGRGDDEIHGGSGKDILVGEEGNDVLDGGSGDDVLNGGAGADTLNGQQGNDDLLGGDNNDFLFGGAGQDLLSGNAGADRLTGGAGADTFIFWHATDLGLGHTDVITDFSHAGGDRIDLSGIDAISTVAGNNQFDFRDGPSTTAGTMWLGAISNGTQSVFMNINGGAADLQIIVNLADFGAPSLVESDFLL